MNSVKHGFIILGLLFATASLLGACGQKGPLIVEQAEPVQEEESEATK